MFLMLRQSLARNKWRQHRLLCSTLQIQNHLNFVSHTLLNCKDIKDFIKHGLASLEESLQCIEQALGLPSSSQS